MRAGIAAGCCAGLAALTVLSAALLALGLAGADTPAPPASAPVASIAPAGAPASATIGISMAPTTGAAILTTTDCGTLTRSTLPEQPPLPLSLAPPRQPLPAARTGRAYAVPLYAEGGRMPYLFGLASGTLPPGLRLDRHGRLCGMPEAQGSYQFGVLLTDADGRQASQTYLLRVAGAASAKPAPATPAASSPPPPPKPAIPALRGLDPSRAEVRAESLPPSAIIYRLQAAQLDALLAEPEPAEATAAAAPPRAATGSLPPPAPALEPAWTEAQQAQLLQMLAPMLEREYPTRDLFLAALEAQRCRHSRELLLASARQQVAETPDEATIARICRFRPPPAATPTDSSKKPRKTGATAAPPVKAAPLKPDQIAWEELPDWLLPAALRDWLVLAAQRLVSLQPAQPLDWRAVPDCDCLSENSQGLVYGIYPAWTDLSPPAQAAAEEDATPKKKTKPAPPPSILDFSLLHRISYLGLPFDTDLKLNQPELWSETSTEFIRRAKHYGTQIDFMLYRRDWDFLRTEPDAAREQLVQRMLENVPSQARELIDRPLPGLRARLQAWLPGFGKRQHMGDGLSLFFDEIPDAGADAKLSQRFAEFYPRFVKALADELRKQEGKRRYALNLAFTEAQLRQVPPFAIERLFELLKNIEEPLMDEGGRIADEGGDYVSKTNVELRFIVLLPDPSGESKKRLRAWVEQSSGLQGSNRRAVLRSIVPVQFLPAKDPLQLQDDLVYFQDNFAGVGFWPPPLRGQNFTAEEQVRLKTTMVRHPPNEVTMNICAFVCQQRWPLRVVFEMLLLAGATIWIALQLNCDWRARWGRYALLAGIPPFLLGAALLHCDPALRALRDGNAQLILLIAIPVLVALWVLLKPKVEKP
ncbi:hypothetical protein G8A07_10975 [Roseateles sp. DAIF2]|uniref:Ig domain-containing protein n=1 Tax=Roseateles sp. DAIF2 TaxID=2714952 RepID=UPI0018A2F447|nr:Ig domain-containing protein [Roseateles sp. DAIF2]QPF73387.1 hypothetical protein G8A07_10975 [Roseateles sp. DAIF2]